MLRPERPDNYYDAFDIVPLKYRPLIPGLRRRGNMVSFEILDASKRMANPMSVEYAVTMPLRRPA